VGEVL
jgi:26S proteasome regulatory subunit T4